MASKGQKAKLQISHLSYNGKGNPVRWADTFYVEVATGKYYFASDLVKEYGRKKLGKLVAEGKFVNEGRWDKMQEEKK